MTSAQNAETAVAVGLQEPVIARSNAFRKPQRDPFIGADLKSILHNPRFFWRRSLSRLLPTQGIFAALPVFNLNLRRTLTAKRLRSTSHRRTDQTDTEQNRKNRFHDVTSPLNATQRNSFL